MQGPLSGICVIDLTTMVSGSLGTMLLADQGAEVIKVENPRTGDHTRLVSTRRGGMSASFVNNNRNKRSLAIDLKAPAGREALMRLLENADVLVQNFRPGVMERLGLGADEVRARAPGLVYVSISGFGAEGPYAMKPVYDPLIQAVSGLASIQGGSDAARPRLVRTIIPDKLTGYVTAQAITAALVQRGRTGRGEAITVNMLDAVVAFLWHSDMGGRTFVGDESPAERAQSFIDLIYETTDGHISVAVNSDKEWAGLCRALDRPDLMVDPRFRTAEDRQKNIDGRLEATQEVLRTGSSAHWLSRLEAEDVGAVPVLTRSEMIEHPQIAANGTLIETDHPSAGRLRQARQAARFAGGEMEIRHAAPALGQHSREILAEAGLTDQEIEALIAEGIAAATETGSGSEPGTMPARAEPGGR